MPGRSSGGPWTPFTFLERRSRDGSKSYLGFTRGPPLARCLLAFAQRLAYRIRTSVSAKATTTITTKSATSGSRSILRQLGAPALLTSHADPAQRRPTHAMPGPLREGVVVD